MDVAPQAESSETIRTTDGLVVTAYGLTDIGRKRSVNQDTLGNRAGQFADARDPRGLLYAVADGMGGHAHGEVASALAIDTIFAHYYADDGARGIQRALDSAMRATNVAVYEAGRAAGGGTMGTTLTAVVLRGKVLHVGNIGDSRTYLIRGGQLKQLSQDHSLVGEQLRRGLLTEEQARASTIRNVITRAIGHNAQVEPDVFAFTVEAGDRLLLCSDGLHGLVENAELARIVGAGRLDEAVRTLIALARERGGPDNITALALSIDQLGVEAGAANAGVIAPIVIGAGDDTPLVLPRLDDVEMVDTGTSAPDEPQTVPTPTVVATVPPASPVSPLSTTHTTTGALAASATTGTALIPARAALTVTPRTPVWLFVIVPLLIVALLVAGGFFLSARRGTPPESAQPAGVPLATSTATVAAGTPVPAVATLTGAPSPTMIPTTSPPTLTPAPAAIGGRPPATASTPTAIREGGFVAPARSPGTSTSTTRQTAIGGTVTIENGIAVPDDFPERWEVLIYEQAEWERNQRTATPRANARLERPLGQNTPTGRYTFRLAITPPPTGGNYIVQLRRDDGTSVATTAGGTLSLAIAASDRVQEFSFRVTGFGGGAEIGR